MTNRPGVEERADMVTRLRDGHDRAPGVRAPAGAGTDATNVRGAGRVWWRLYRHHLRLLRNTAIAWLAVLAGIGPGFIATIEDTYGPDELARIGPTLEGVPAFEALFGRTVAMDTLEGFALWRWGGFAVLLAAIWGMLAANRLLRGAEEAGHLEPLRAGAVTPRRLLAAAVAAMLSVYALLAAAVGVGHSAVGMDAATAWSLGGALALLAASFAALGALAAQLVATRRRAMGLVALVLGVSVAVRVLAAATATPDWVWWATPFGWASHLHEVDEARTAVFVSFAVLVVTLLAAAFALADRDLHAARFGGDHATARRLRPVGGQLGLASRLATGSMLSWGSGIAAGGLVFGLLADDFSAALADLGTPLQVFERIGFVGMDTPEGVIGLTLGFLVLVLTLFAAAQAAAVRDEEAAWRIEHLLVRPVGRVHWLLTRTVVAAVAVLVLAIVAAVAAWLGTVVTAAPIGLADAVLAGVNLVPVAWLFLGVGVALFGLAPRATAPAVYGLVLVAYLLDLVGALLDLPAWALDASPFRHLAAAPAEDIALVPAAVMVAGGVAGVLVGLAAFRRRDLREA